MSHALLKKKHAHDSFLEIMTILIERKETIETLETRCDEGWGLARDSAGEIHNLEIALKEEQELEFLLRRS